MKSSIRRNILLGTLLVAGFISSVFAEPTLPVSSQITDNKKGTTTKEEKIEIVPEIKIQTQTNTTATNPKLKQGDACADEDLEEAQGEVFTEIPMAETIPCNEVDCKDLKPAQMKKDNYKELNTAKTINCAT